MMEGGVPEEGQGSDVLNEGGGEGDIPAAMPEAQEEAPVELQE